MKSKKALSAIVSTILIIAIVFVAGGIIFGIVKNVVDKNLKKSKSCFNLYDQITLNDEYTCYNSSGQYLEFSIDREEISLDSLRVGITWGTGSKVFVLANSNQNLQGVTNYPDHSSGVKLPDNSSGQTYFAEGIPEKPTKIEISPKRNGNNCQTVDEISLITECS